MSMDAAGSTEAEKGLMGTGSGVASFDEEGPSPLRRLQRFLHEFPTTIPAIVVLAGLLVFAVIAGETFFQPRNMSLILQQVTVIAILGVAQTLVILTAGIDLSVGAIMVLSSIVMGKLAIHAGFPPAIGLMAGFLTGIVCGFLNGVLIALVRLPPFIVTLGTWSIFGALVIFVSRSQTIRSQEIEQTAPILHWMRERLDLGDGAVLTLGSVVMIGIALGVWYLLNRTAFGRHVYATGDDPEAARLAGINTSRTLILVYTLAGFICSLAAWVTIGRVGAVSPLGNQEANLDAITAVVIGGTSLFGGRGSIIGTLLGALIVGVFRSGLAQAGVDVLWQQFAVGVLIILAVAIDQWIRKLSA